MNASDIFSLLEKLRQNKIYFELASHREDAIMVVVTVPGEIWEIEFLEDGEVEIEVFRSDGQIFDESELNSLFSRFSD